MTQIDEPNLDEQIESDLLDMWLLWERGNWYLNDDHPNYDKEHDRRFRDAIVEYITKLIADEVKKARIDEVKSLSDTFDTMHQKTEGGGFVHYGEFGEYLDDRIAELKEEDK